MTNIRLTPVLLWDGSHQVLSRNFKFHQKTGNLIDFAGRLKVWDVDEIIVLNIAPYYNSNLDKIESHKKFCEVISEISQDCFAPLIAGGGLNSVSSIDDIIHAGADRVIINSAAYSNLELVTQAAKVLGSQAIIGGIDVRKEGTAFKTYSNAGTEEQSLNPVDWAVTLQEAGAGEILVQSIDQDGLGNGYDLEIIEKIRIPLEVPIVALGGARSSNDFKRVIEIGASSAAASNLFVFNELSYPKIKTELSQSCNTRHCSLFDFHAVRQKANQESTTESQERSLWSLLDNSGLME
ncbi:HisA/HisF-related TIM barrel protein [Owenweeksia hongkongensis]|uniref:HisA/HisF-related TIM barrel protein n=1 Tax=Owenweeksia hongkongensis TaxID=253245 RepID=UPI003A8D7B2B